MIVEVTTEPREWVLPEGSLRIWEPRPGTVLTAVDGRFVMSMAEHVMAAVDRVARERPGRGVVVHDWTAVQSYEVAVHARMTPWAVGVTRSLSRVIIGVHSPLVALAVRAANLAVGGRFELCDSRPALLNQASLALSAVE